MRSCLQRVSWLAILVLTSLQLSAQTLYPAAEGQKTRFTAYFDLSRGYISGAGMMLHTGDSIKCAIFNEFGITAVDFIYLVHKDKVKLRHIVSAADKWYVRRLMRKELRNLMHALRQGQNTFTDPRHGITLTLTPLKDPQEETRHETGE